MSSAHIVCVGDELLSGSTSDVHGAFLASFLTQRGVAVDRISLVGDDHQAIMGVLAMATARSRLVLVTGGLGPTSDDCTRDALGMLVGQELEFDEALWEEIQRTLGRKLRGSNRRQAYRPALFSPLLNARGTAPGLMGEVGGCRVVALPGPPGELRGMIEVHGDQIVDSIASEPAPALVITCFGIPESRLEDVLSAAARRLEAAGVGAGSVSWHTRAEQGRIVLRLTGGEEAARLSLLSSLRDQFDAARLADGETTLPETLVRELAMKKVTMSAAESCTGGMLGAAITDVPGSSAVFWGSLVTYANAAKTGVLGVGKDLLEKHGAVSEETVVAMARGVRSVSGSDLSVAISGVAGPDGGTPEKPVGTVWIAVESAAGCVTRRFSFSGDRARVRRGALVEAMILLRADLGIA